MAPDAAHVFPRYVYDALDSGQGELIDLDSEAGRRDNITDEALAAYRARYGEDVTKDDIFAYVCGVLHSPEYRERYATDLAKMLPRIHNLGVPGVRRGGAAAARPPHRVRAGGAVSAARGVGGGRAGGDARWRVEKMRWA